MEIAYDDRNSSGLTLRSVEDGENSPALQVQWLCPGESSILESLDVEIHLEAIHLSRMKGLNGEDKLEEMEEK